MTAGVPSRASYLDLPVAELDARAAKALLALQGCQVCPRRCGVDRIRDEMGSCRIGRRAVVSSFGPHGGEEDPISGTEGSGTIFFSGCNLHCVFCQNSDISQSREGRAVDGGALARIMLAVQEQGCHNVNLVSPSHVVPQILEALAVAVRAGLTVPIVYNTGGYDSLEMLAALDGIVDIYMPDFKYSGKDEGVEFSNVRSYPSVAMAAIREMHRQVGDLRRDPSGVARRGLLVRHLVLPNGLAGTRRAMEFLASLSPDTYVNVMAQYRPCHRAAEFADRGLDRRPTQAEIARACAMALEAGLHRLDPRSLRR